MQFLKKTVFPCTLHKLLYRKEPFFDLICRAFSQVAWASD